MLIAVSTALIGPVSFLGFIGSNLAYRTLNDYRHSVLFIGGSLISHLFIIIGQVLVEHVFRLQTTLGVIIQFVGGIYFLVILLKERNRSL
ncbi:iron chelate uptake ABC transporter family permease subunit [Alkalibacterium iburiense]|uniref:iron chelate uptake ABC transporter family permease subunit n=1 Tax=Alkalibacterium iburiense TaxID=290589 RepID=UPI003CD0830A